MKAGLRRIARNAEALGIRTPVSRNPAMTLGGLNTGVTALDMAHAYSSLAEGGLRVTGSLGTAEGGPVGITKVALRDNKSDVLDANKRERSRVLPAAVADETTRVLQSVITAGTAKSANLGAGIPQWGKTGTTENYGDAWFVGTSGPITVAVWVGYPDRLKPMETEWRGQPVAGGTYPAAIWKQFMLSLRALVKQKLEKQCEDEAAKKTEKCRDAGLGDVPTTTTPTPAPGTVTTPSDGGTSTPGQPDTATPNGGGVAPTTATPTPHPRRRPRRHSSPCSPRRRRRRPRSRHRRRPTPRAEPHRRPAARRPARADAQAATRRIPAATAATRGCCRRREAPRQVGRLRDPDTRPDRRARALQAARRRAERTGPSRTLVSLWIELDAERLRELARDPSTGRPDACARAAAPSSPAPRSARARG